MELETIPLIQNKRWAELLAGVNSDYAFGIKSIGGSQTGVESSNLMLYDAVVDWEGHGDFLTIQEAIDADKKRLFVRAGTYDLASPIIIKDNPDVQITGESNTANGTKITSSTMTASALIKYQGASANAYGFLLENLYLYGADMADMTGIRWEMDDDVIPTQLNISVKNCKIEAFDFVGFRVFTGYVKANINNNEFEKCLFGILTPGEAAGGFFESNIRDNIGTMTKPNSYFMVIVDDTSYTDVIGNKMTVLADGCFGIYFIGTGAVPAVCRITDNSWLNYGGYATTEDAFYFKGIREFIITSNNISFCGKNGIYMEDCESNVVSGNRIYYPSYLNANAYNGITLEGASLYNVITGNSIDGVSSNLYGIAEIGAGCDNNVVTSNMIFNSGVASIILVGGNTEYGHTIEQ